MGPAVPSDYLIVVERRGEADQRGRWESLKDTQGADGADGVPGSLDVTVKEQKCVHSKLYDTFMSKLQLNGNNIEIQNL